MDSVQALLTSPLFGILLGCQKSLSPLVVIGVVIVFPCLGRKVDSATAQLAAPYMHITRYTPISSIPDSLIIRIPV